jgi:hypothetical protein
MITSSPPALTLPLRTPQSVPRVPLVPPTNIEPRFTVDGSDELECHLDTTCRKIAAGVSGLVPPRRLEAILLGGGYGRGEGGVLRTDTGDRPYNDLEFYVCVRGNRLVNELRFGHALHVLGEILTPQAGVEVEFKITSLHELEHSDVSMFSYDLIAGHRWLLGNEELLARGAHHRDASQIPLVEATRLLMNRCSGLLFAKERLEQSTFTAGDADFVRRNIAKAELALGDAILVAAGQYHWSVRERARRLAALTLFDAMPWMGEVRKAHAAGVEFKLHPERSTASREHLRALHAPVTALAKTVWLWLEPRRLGAAFASAREYALSELNKFPHTRTARNLLVNARILGTRSLRERRAHRHPRERVLHAVALLLWEPDALATPELRLRLQRELQTESTTFADVMRAYRAVWTRVN